MHTIARTLYVGLLAGTGFALLGAEPLSAPPSSPKPASPSAPHSPRVVYLGGSLSDEALITLGSFAAGRPGSLLLLDSKPLSSYLKHFLAAYRPDRIIPVGAFPEGKSGLERRLGARVDEPVAWAGGPPRALWRIASPEAASVVVCPAKPRSALLRAACLAAAKRCPLWVRGARPAEALVLEDWLKRWGAREVIAVGAVGCPNPGGRLRRLVRLPSEQAIDAEYLRWLAANGRIETAVIANPADVGRDTGGVSALAPWLAATKRAALLLTNDTGTDVERVVSRASENRRLRRLDSLILVASPKALPMLERPNPIPGDKDPAIELEPLTPPTRGSETAPAGAADEPVSYAVGRLFHEDRAVLPLLMARQELMARAERPRRALVASNPGGSLPLLEAFSRNTAQELKNSGYEVTALYGKDVTGPELRKQMVGKDLFLWEGHHNTLIKDWGFASWDEPLPPTFVFLQSCLALKDYKVQPLLSRGAIGVLGSSTRTYSGSGGAFSLAFFNALVYEGQTLGGSLRQAKNFLLAYALLKEKRLGAQAARTGANHRAAWAFTLWGDPTFRLPRPGAPSSALSAVRHEVTGNVIVVDLPTERHDEVTTAKYQVRMPPNSRLAGLVRKMKEEDGQALVPFVFAEVRLPRAGQAPRLRTRLPASRWVFVWDQRRRTGYLLAAPRPQDRGELRFHVEWPGATVAGKMTR
jgi:hypothetical protein